MDYIYLNSMRTGRKWKDSSGKIWKYKKQKEVPLFGDVYRTSKYTTDNRLVDGQDSLEVGAVQKKTGIFHKITGYIPCMDSGGNRGSVRIISLAWERILTLCVILLLLMAACIYLYRSNTGPKDLIEDFTFPTQMENTEEGKVSIPDYTVLEKQEDEEKTMTWLYNVTGNPYGMQYVIYLDEGKQLLYESEILQPGQVIRGFTPEADLKEGVYPYEMEVRLFELSDSREEVSVQKFEGEYRVYGEEQRE